MTPEEIRRAFEPWRRLHGKAAWRPVTSGTQAGASFFGGTPEGSSSATWPLCRQCAKPMQFFLQLDIATLPERFGLDSGSGALQLFYCATDDGMCDTWEPFSGAHELRVFEAPVAIARPAGVDALAAKSILSWEAFTDTPHPEEHERCGLSYVYDFDNHLVTVTCSDPQRSFEDLDSRMDVAELISNAKSGDKLGGWPYWIQSVEYPSCPRCQSTMRLVMQIDSQDNLDYMFGDMGCGHITQCEAHPDVVAFGWACS